jgi:hypothetical protein
MHSIIGKYCRAAFSIRHTGFGRKISGLRKSVVHCANRLNGHQQITDAYLLGLAIHKKGRLATLDAGLASLVADQSGLKNRLTFI